MEAAILTVRELTERLRKTIEGNFPFVWVRGEVSNLSRPASGHLYFSLKDQDAQMQCVWFQHMQRRQHQHFDPLTGEVFDKPRPPLPEIVQNGQELLCAGRIGIYAPRGQYQLMVEMAQPAGQGVLAKALEESRCKLAAQGFFGIERKRRLPPDPQRVAVITSPRGAALQDFLELARGRGGGAHIRIFPALMQGAEAAPSIVRAMSEANEQEWAQVIVLIRGGGSLEDLWAFNEESVAQAVFCSRLPVLAGVGHEVDTTLADMTADVRAATPSHAAQILWPLRSELEQRVDEAALALRRVAKRRVDMYGYELERCESALRWLSPLRSHKRLADQVEALETSLRRAAARWLNEKEARCARLEQARLAALDAEKIGMLEARLAVLEGAFCHALPSLLEKKEKLFALATQSLHAAGAAVHFSFVHRLEGLASALEVANPLALLKRGYAFVRTREGVPVRSARAVSPGEKLDICLHDGILEAVVSGFSPAGKTQKRKNKGALR